MKLTKEEKEILKSSQTVEDTDSHWLSIAHVMLLISSSIFTFIIISGSGHASSCGTGPTDYVFVDKHGKEHGSAYVKEEIPESFKTAIFLALPFFLAGFTMLCTRAFSERKSFPKDWKSRVFGEAIGYLGKGLLFGLIGGLIFGQLNCFPRD